MAHWCRGLPAIVIPISGFLVACSAEGFVSTLHRLLHRQFIPLRIGAESRPSPSLPRAPGRFRGRTATDDASNSRGYLPARETWTGFRPLWCDGHLRPCNRSDFRAPRLVMIKAMRALTRYAAAGIEDTGPGNSDFPVGHCRLIR